MKTLDIYISRRCFYDGPRLVGTLLDVAFDPIEPDSFVDPCWSLRHVVEGCARPTLVLSLPGCWEVTHAHGITNVAMSGMAVTIAGVEGSREYVPPRAMLALARSRSHGITILSGTDPFTAETSDRDLITQGTLFKVGA